MAQQSISAELKAALSKGGTTKKALTQDEILEAVTNEVAVEKQELADNPAGTTALQHVEAWWQEVLASAPAPSQMSLDTYVQGQWGKLAERLRGL